MIVRIAVIVGLVLATVALVILAAVLFAVGEMRNERGWTVGAIVAGAGAVFTLGRLRDYADMH